VWGIIPAVDQAWIAVLGGVVGAGGAASAAALTGWFGRRQAAVQQSGQREQWQREKRREAYSAFLDAGAQARDELAAARRELSRPAPGLGAARDRLNAAAPLVMAVRRASAAIFVEGPESMLEPTRRAEEHVVILHELLGDAADDLGNGRPVSDQMGVCVRQEVWVRELLDQFAAAARHVFTGAQETSRLLPAPPTVSFEEELAWLVLYLSAELGCTPESIDSTRPAFEVGLDSLDMVKLANRMGDRFGLSGRRIWPVSSLLFDGSIADMAAHVARLRKEG
jgi:hypothetical protein